MFSRILSALLVVAVSSPVGVLGQFSNDTAFTDFADSITAVDSLLRVANRTDTLPDIGIDFKCIALAAADAVAVGSVIAAKGTPVCFAAQLACSAANAACNKAKCSGCIGCPSC